MYRPLAAVLLTLIATTGCTEPDANGVPTVGPIPSVEMAVVSRTAMGAGVVGVTVDPVSGQRYSLSGDEGLFALQDGTLEHIADWETLTPLDGADRRPYTDAVALGDGRFAITVAGDGLLYDHQAGTSEQYFCYEPDEGEWEGNFQLTNSVSFHASTGMIVAQPQTLTMFDEIAIASSIGLWDVNIGGEPVQWYELPWVEFTAGGIVMDTADTVLMGHQSVVFSYTLGQDGDPIALVDLASFGISDVQGLSIDPKTDNLIVLDGASTEMVELSNWR